MLPAEGLTTKRHPWQTSGHAGMNTFFNSHFKGAILGEGSRFGKTSTVLVTAKTILEKKKPNCGCVLVAARSVSVNMWRKDSLNF